MWNCDQANQKAEVGTQLWDFFTRRVHILRIAAQIGRLAKTVDMLDFTSSYNSKELVTTPWSEPFINLAL